jgi:glutamate/tyrosine decarboxylase-like PLP-dependent enzyme
VRELGSDGIAALVERCCRYARRFADGLGAGGAEIGNDVVLNQVLARFGDDAWTDAVVDAVQREGTCWLGGTTWRGRRWIRVAVSNATTTEEDVDRSVAAVLRAAGGARPARRPALASSGRRVEEPQIVVDRRRHEHRVEAEEE